MQCIVFTQTPDKLNSSSSDQLSPILEMLRAASRGRWSLGEEAGRVSNQVGHLWHHLVINNTDQSHVSPNCLEIDFIVQRKHLRLGPIQRVDVLVCNDSYAPTSCRSLQLQCEASATIKASSTESVFLSLTAWSCLTTQQRPCSEIIRSFLLLIAWKYWSF